MSAPRPHSRSSRPETGEGLRERLAAVLRRRDRRRVPEEACEARAAVTLVLRPDSPAGDADREARPEVAGGGEKAGRRADAGSGAGVSVLFVQRAEADGDPWSGHMALPGGRREPADPDLTATAIRETREETALRLREADVLGRLSDVVPASPHLPAIAITPFVVWYEGQGEVRASREIRDHVWIPLEALASPDHRSVLRLQREGASVAFPAIEYRGYTVWGITFEIIADFLRLLREAEPDLRS